MNEFFSSVEEAHAVARDGAEQIRQHLHIEGDVFASVFLGTGWGSSFTFTKQVPLSRITGFHDIPKLEGHARTVALTTFDDKQILVHQGRLHLYEGYGDPNIARMVRTQIELDMYLGVRHVVLTCAAGGLDRKAPTGSIMLIDGFLTLSTPDLPTIGAEFCCGEDALIDPETRNVIVRKLRAGMIDAHQGGYAMMRGAMFEGRKYDKQALAMLGASCVGMSIVPEAMVVDAYNRSVGERRAQVTALAFISNNAIEEHSHRVNIARAVEKKDMLAKTLRTVLATLS